MDIDIAEHLFSLEDLQYLRYHFEVFSAVSPFSLTVDKKERVTRLDAYLDMRDAQIAYQERARKALQERDQTPMLSELKEDTQNETELENIPQQLLVRAKDDLVEDTQDKATPVDNPDPMGPSVLENMEISMVHVLPVEFQPITSQPKFLDGDVVAE